MSIALSDLRGTILNSQVTILITLTEVTHRGTRKFLFVNKLNLRICIYSNITTVKNINQSTVDSLRQLRKGRTQFKTFLDILILVPSARHNSLGPKLNDRVCSLSDDRI